MRIGVEKRPGAHQLARRAEATLRRVVLGKRLLQRIEPAVAGETFYRLNRAAIHPDGQAAAGVDRLSVDQHGARPTLTAFAAQLGTRQVQVIPENLSERPTVFYANPVDRSVDLDPDGRDR